MVRQLQGLVVPNTSVSRFLYESVYEGLAIVSDIKTTDYLQYQLDLKIRGSIYRTTIYWHRCYDIVAFLDKKRNEGEIIEGRIVKVNAILKHVSLEPNIYEMQVWAMRLRRKA